MPSRPFVDNRMAVINQVTQPSYLERRSTVANDNGVVAPDAPPAFYTCDTLKGKFFPRGMRGKIEGIQIYCRDAGVDIITLRYSVFPGLGPVGVVNITPLATWSWVTADVEEMWNYDSLFVWVYACLAGTDWGYEVARPYDGHSSGDAGATWEDLAVRPFIRVLYAAQTVGDIPVSGIVNNIPLPYYSTGEVQEFEGIVQNIQERLLTVYGAGYCDLVRFSTTIGANSHLSQIIIIMDDVEVLTTGPAELNTFGCDQTTPRFTLTAYNVDGWCNLIISKRWEFRRMFAIDAFNGAGNAQVTATCYPTLIR